MYVRQAADKPPDVWVLPVAGGELRRVTRLNPTFASIPMGKAKMLSYPGPDGKTLHAALLLPPGWKPGHRLPVIVVPYGSANRSDFINYFGFGLVGDVDNMQVFATRGYGVLLPDAPVRTGTPMKDIASTVLAGVDEVIRLVYADPERIGVMGHSYGGYTVFSLIAQTHRFRAAVVSAGFSEWLTWYGAMSDGGSAQGITQAETRQYGLGGSPWEVRDRYVANAPFYIFDGFTTPTLIIHGTNDYIPDMSAKMSFVALRRLDKDVVLVLYRGEGHLLASYPNKLDYLQRVIAWFDRYLCSDRASPTACTL